MLIEDRFQDEDVSLDYMIAELAVEIAGEHLADKKYQGKRVWNCENDKTHSLPLHVHQRIISILNIATWDIGNCAPGSGCTTSNKTRPLFEYKGLSIKLQDQIIDKTFEYIMENCLGENDRGEPCLFAAKAGTGTDRANDAKMYPKSCVDRSKQFKFDMTISSDQRPQLERYTMLFLASLGIGFNLNFTNNTIPHTDKCDPDLYLMAANSELVSFLANHGLNRYGDRLSEGWVAVRVGETTNLGIGGDSVESEVCDVSSEPTATSQLPQEDTEETSDLIDNAEIVNTDTTPAAPTAAGGVADKSSGAVARGTEDDDSTFDFNCTDKYGDEEDEDVDEDDLNVPTFFGGTPSSSTSPHELLSISLSSDKPRVVTPTNVPDNLSIAMERKLAAETSFYEANAAKAELEARDLQRKDAVRDLCERTKRRFVESHLPTNPKRVRAVLENEQLVESVVSSSYKGTEVAPPLLSQDVCGKLEQMVPDED